MGNGKEVGLNSVNYDYIKSLLVLGEDSRFKLPKEEKERLATMLHQAGEISREEIKKLGMKIVPAEQEEIR